MARFFRIVNLLSYLFPIRSSQPSHGQNGRSKKTTFQCKNAPSIRAAPFFCISTAARIFFFSFCRHSEVVQRMRSLTLSYDLLMLAARGGYASVCCAMSLIKSMLAVIINSHNATPLKTARLTSTQLEDIARVFSILMVVSGFYACLLLFVYALLGLVRFTTFL